MQDFTDVLGSALLAGIHGIGGGVWIGAVAFNLFVLTPRARAWFGDPGEHEDFVFSIVHGLRWPVAAGALAVVATGAWRFAARAPLASSTWSVIMASKLLCAVTSLGLFGWVTLRLWPRRVFATPPEQPAIRRRFFWTGVGIVAANTIAAALGVLAGELSRVP